MEVTVCSILQEDSIIVIGGLACFLVNADCFFCIGKSLLILSYVCIGDRRREQEVGITDRVLFRNLLCRLLQLLGQFAGFVVFALLVIYAYHPCCDRKIFRGAFPDTREGFLVAISLALSIARSTTKLAVHSHLTKSSGILGIFFCLLIGIGSFLQVGYGQVGVLQPEKISAAVEVGLSYAVVVAGNPLVKPCRNDFVHELLREGIILPGCCSMCLDMLCLGIKSSVARVFTCTELQIFVGKLIGLLLASFVDGINEIVRQIGHLVSYLLRGECRTGEYKNQKRGESLHLLFFGRGDGV